MTKFEERKSTADRIGRLVGHIYGVATQVASGYIWAKHGIFWGAALWVFAVGSVYALYGFASYHGERR